MLRRLAPWLILGRQVVLAVYLFRGHVFHLNLLSGKGWFVE